MNKSGNDDVDMMQWSEVADVSDTAHTSRAPVAAYRRSTERPGIRAVMPPRVLSVCVCSEYNNLSFLSLSPKEDCCVGADAREQLTYIDEVGN